MAAAAGLFVGPILSFLGPILDRILPDKNKQLELQNAITLAAMQQEGQALQGQLQLALGQLDINKAEAASGNAYAASWRPTIGYVCAIALAFHYLINPLMLWIVVLTHAAINPPDIQLDNSLWQLMFGMLGLGAMRSYEKVQSVKKP